MRNNKNEFNLWGDWNVCTFELLWLFFGKEVVFSKTYPSFLTVKEGSTSHPSPLQWSLHPLRFPRLRGTETSGAREKTALRCSEPLCSKVGGPSKVFAMLCGMGPPGCCGGRSNAASKPSPWLCGMGPPGNSSL